MKAWLATNAEAFFLRDTRMLMELLSISPVVLRSIRSNPDDACFTRSGDFSIRAVPIQLERIP